MKNKVRLRIGSISGIGILNRIDWEGLIETRNGLMRAQVLCHFSCWKRGSIYTFPLEPGVFFNQQRLAEAMLCLVASLASRELSASTLPLGVQNCHARTFTTLRVPCCEAAQAMHWEKHVKRGEESQPSPHCFPLHLFKSSSRSPRHWVQK